jgi:hypothetical protein
VDISWRDLHDRIDLFFNTGYEAILAVCPWPESVEARPGGVAGSRACTGGSMRCWLAWDGTMTAIWLRIVRFNCQIASAASWWALLSGARPLDRFPFTPALIVPQSVNHGHEIDLAGFRLPGT